VQTAEYRITGVTPADTFVEAYFETQVDVQLGSALRVYLTDKATAGQEVLLRVKYETTNDSLAINWLTPD
jgi:hypothetical protein